VSRRALRREEVDLTRMAQHITGRLQRDAPEREVEIVIAPGMRTVGDMQLLEQALENLLQNAWKFSSGCSPARIELGCQEEGARPVYFISDNGVGFDMRYADRLFSPFSRLHSDREFPGTGIGLSTVQRIIQRHGGEVWLDSALNQGTTVFFTVALEEDER
jgi:signal transduction histidine kinase